MQNRLLVITSSPRPDRHSEHIGSSTSTTACKCVCVCVCVSPSKCLSLLSPAHSGHKKKNLIILVDKDSNDKLNELFDKALSNKVPLQIPYRMRKLPESFFMPPSSGSKSPSVSHSRENSADSAFGSGTTILGGVAGVAATGPSPKEHDQSARSCVSKKKKTMSQECVCERERRHCSIE